MQEGIILDQGIPDTQCHGRHGHEYMYSLWLICITATCKQEQGMANGQEHNEMQCQRTKHAIKIFSCLRAGVRRHFSMHARGGRRLGVLSGF